MWSKVFATAGLALAAVVVPMEAAGQAGTVTAPDSVSAEEAPAAAPAVDRREQIAARIREVQQKALQDPALRAANSELSALISATAARLDPAYASYGQRATALKAEVAAAQAASDNARLHELADEAKQLQASINAAQARAKEDPAVKQKLDELKVKLFNRMAEIDPTVPDLVKELETQNGSR